MAMRSDVYVDTSALIALLDGSDRHHDRFVELFARPPALLTSCLVVGEGHAWFLRRLGPSQARRFLEFIESMSPLTIAPVGPAEQAGGFAMLRSHPDQDLTLADGVGLHLMRVYSCSTCWSTDRHLGLTGVPLAIP